MTPRSFASFLSILAGGTVALALLAGGMIRADAVGVGMDAARSAGVVISAGLIATFLRRGFRADESSIGLHAQMTLPLLILLGGAAATFAIGGLIPDLSLRTIGRPMEFFWPITAWLAVVTIAAVDQIKRGTPTSRAGLLLLLPMLALEGGPLHTPSSAGLLAASLLLLLSAFDPLSRRLPLFVPIIGVVASFAISTYFAADPTPGVDVTIRLTTLAIGFWLIAGDVDPQKSARIAIASLLSTALVVAWLGLLSKGLLAREIASLPVNPLSTELSLFGRHPNTIAPWFGASTVISCRLAFERPSRLRALARVTLPFVAIATLLTASRITILGALAIMPVMLVLSRLRWRQVALLGGVALGATLLAIVFIPPVRMKVMDHASLERSASHRMHRYRIAIATAQERPWLGQGPLCWFRQGAFAPSSRFEGESTDDHPHSLPLALWVSVGGGGLFAVASLLAAAAHFVFVRRRELDPSDRALVLAVSAALVVQLFTNLFDAGDSTETLLPSRLPIDLGILVALARVNSGSLSRRGMPLGPLPRSVTAWLFLPVGAIVFFGETLIDRGEALAREEAFERCRADWELGAKLLPYHLPVRMSLIGWGSKNRDLSFANHYLVEAEEIAPDRPSLHEYRARIRLAAGQLQPALRAAERAFELDKTGLTARQIAPLLAELRLATGDTVGGIEVMGALLRQDPGSIAPFIDRDSGRVIVGSQSFPADDLIAAIAPAGIDEATLALRRRVPIRKGELQLMLGRPEEALAAADELLALEGTKTLNYHTLRFDAFVAANEPERALAEADALLEFGRDPFLIEKRADALHRLGRTEEALPLFDAAFPDGESLYYFEAIYRGVLGNRARLLADLGETDEQIEVLENLSLLQQDAELRIETLLEIARLTRESGRTPSLDRHLAPALRLLLRLAATDSSRSLARQLGTTFGELGNERVRNGDDRPSHFADEWERYAYRRGGGTLLHEFQVALLVTLHLEERAARSRAWLAD